MGIRRGSRAGRILAAALVVFVALTGTQAVLNGQMGTLAGLLLAAGFGLACFRAGRRRSQTRVPQALGSPARAVRAPARPRRSPRARMARDAARLLISRR
jgi:hypothetical protein